MVFGMLDPSRFELSSLRDVQREVGRWVALVADPDLITVPGADAPEPAMAIPAMSHAQMPSHDAREGVSLHRRRRPYTQPQVPLPPVPEPTPDVYYPLPYFETDPDVSYTWPADIQTCAGFESEPFASSSRQGDHFAPSSIRQGQPFDDCYIPHIAKSTPSTFGDTGGVRTDQGYNLTPLAPLRDPFDDASLERFMGFPPGRQEEFQFQMDQAADYTQPPTEMPTQTQTFAVPRRGPHRAARDHPWDCGIG
jgi:hypothetical protein